MPRMTSQGSSAHLVPTFPVQIQVAPVVQILPLPAGAGSLSFALAVVPAEPVQLVAPAMRPAEQVLALAAEAVPPPPQSPSHPSTCPSSSVPPNASPPVLSAHLDGLLPHFFRRKAYPKHR